MKENAKPMPLPKTPATLEVIPFVETLAAFWSAREAGDRIRASELSRAPERSGTSRALDKRRA